MRPEGSPAANIGVAREEQEPTVRSIGEQGLLKRLQAFCPAGVIGDDGAVLQVSADRRLVVTTDVLVDGVHFSIGLANSIVTTPPHAVGFRAAAADAIEAAVTTVLDQGYRTGDIASEGMTIVGCKAMGEALLKALDL